MANRAGGDVQLKVRLAVAGLIALSACGEDEEPAAARGVVVKCVDPDIMRDLVGAALDELRVNGWTLDDFELTFAPDSTHIAARDPLNDPVVVSALRTRIAQSELYTDCRLEPPEG